MSQPAPTHIYILGFSDGIVKVGRTSNPKSRIACLASEGRRRGAEIEHRWVTPHENPKYAEWYLRMIGLAFSKRAWGTEYFYSDFAAFLALVRAKFERYGIELEPKRKTA